jgi:CHASE3 domain sensor protein
MIPIQRIRDTVLRLAFILPVLALLATIWVARETSGEFNTAFSSLTHTYKELNLLEETLVHAGDAETGQRGWLLTGREDYLAAHGAAMAALHNDLQQLGILFRDNPSEQAYVAGLQKLIDQRLALDRNAARPGNPNSTAESAVALTVRGSETMKQIRVALFRLREQGMDLLVVQQQRAEAKFLFDQTALFVLMGVTAIALIAVVAVLLRLEHLRQIVTICAWTGQVKHEGEWIRLEEYLKRRFGLAVSHGLSKEAAEKMMREIHKPNAPPNPG